MHYFVSALLVATFLFTRPNVAFPTIFPAADVSSMSDAVKLLADSTYLEKRALNGDRRSLCKLDKVQLPVGNGDTTLSGAGTMKLKMVAIGYGTQNYTCADATANSKPVANGAQATLFDASCFASFAPDILKWLPPVFLHQEGALPMNLLPDVGMHYFHPDASTPVFDVNKIEPQKIGLFVGKKAEFVPAPSNADAGVAPYQYGAVDWLKLVAKAGVMLITGEALTSKGYKAVYRVNTAGGKPPATCEGQPAAFNVGYATQYWLYN